MVVVGGGIAGLAAAWHLRDRDVRRARGERPARGPHPLGAPRRVLAQFRRARLRGPGQRLAPSDRGGRRRDPARSRPPRGRLAERQARLERPRRALPVPAAAASRRSCWRSSGRVSGCASRCGATPRSRVQGPGESAAERQQRLLEFMDDRSFAEFMGRLPPDVDALFRCTLTRSSGEPEKLAAGYGVGYFHLVWNRGEGLSTNIVGGSSTLHRGHRGRARRPRAHRRAGRAGDAGGRRRRRGVRLRESFALARRSSPRPRMPRARSSAGFPRRRPTPLQRSRTARTSSAASSPTRHGPRRGTTSTPWRRRSARSASCSTRAMHCGSTAVGSQAARSRSRRRPTRHGGSRASPTTRSPSASEPTCVDLFPALDGAIVETKIVRWERGLPHPTVGRSRLQPALTRDLSPIFLAGDYLGIWYTETAIQTAELAAAGARGRPRSVARHRLC